MTIKDVWSDKYNQAPLREDIGRLFAVDLMEDVVGQYRRLFPSDDRPARALEVTRQYANGEASIDDLVEAHLGAYRAAEQAECLYGSCDVWSAAYAAAECAKPDWTDYVPLLVARMSVGLAEMSPEGVRTLEERLSVLGAFQEMERRVLAIDTMPTDGEEAPRQTTRMATI